MKRTLSSALVLTIGVGLAAQGLAQQPTILQPTIEGSAITSDQPAPPPPVASPPAAAAAAAQQAPTPVEELAEVVRKRIGEDHFLPVDAARIAVTNPRVITATQLPDRSGIIVTMRATGISDLRLFQADGRMIVYRFQVVGTDIAEQLNQLRDLLAEVPTVTAKRTGDHIVINGTLLSLEDERRYDEILKRFDVLDMVERRFSTVEQQRRIESVQAILRERGLEGVNARLVSRAGDDMAAYLTGVVVRPEEKAQAEGVAEMFFGRVESHINVRARLVELDVVLITVDFSKDEQRGQNIFDQLNTMDFKVGVFEDDGATLAIPGWGGGSGPAGIRGEEWSYTWIPEGTVTAALRAAKGSTYVSYYAEPFLTVVDGETGVFQDGGTAYVALTSQENVGVAQVDTGIQLTVTPYIEENGKIRVKVLTDVSVESENVPTFEGSGIAGTLNVKRAKTESVIEVGDGQTIVVAGSNSNLFDQTMSKTPLLGDIPILNLWFKSKDRKGSNVRSFFFITPRLAPTQYQTADDPFSRQAPKAKAYYELDSQYRPSTVGYWLGWEDDLPEPEPEKKDRPEDVYSHQGALVP